jgi:hypothetical protein
MTRDDIIEVASKAGFETKRDMIWVDQWEITPTLTRFAALVAAAERERIIAANAPEIERINAHIKELEQARLEEREACAKVCDYQHDRARTPSGAARANACAAAIRARGQQRPEPTYPSDPIWREQKRLEMEAWARNKLARHGINPCPDCHGIGYDASGQLCACQENPSF